MYERRYGSKYRRENESGDWLSAADIAKLMRADIKAAIGKGELSGKMANYSVRVHNYSGGRSINIEARDLDGMWEDCDGTKLGTEIELAGGGYIATACSRYEHGEGKTHDRLTAEGARIHGILQGIHNAYNYDGSEIMVDYFDVNYYGHAEIEDERSRQSRLREKARKDAKKAKAAS